mmetsp:Transcript_36908/g.96672  ORF Transcript_36908/g.96672 Transcript_36908/m.96672 type:complete len:96 (+) Transcript_36908:319-606(+)
MKSAKHRQLTADRTMWSRHRAACRVRQKDLDCAAAPAGAPSSAALARVLEEQHTPFDRGFTGQHRCRHIPPIEFIDATVAIAGAHTVKSVRGNRR